MDQFASVIPVLLLQMLHTAFPQFSEKAENGSYAQQDANECWSELVKVLQQKLFIVGPDGTKKQSFITQYFGGRFQSTLKCVENDESSEATEDFLQLSCFINQGNCC